MESSSTTCRQKEMNRMRLAYWQGGKRIRRLPNTVNTDLFFIINNFLKIRLVDCLK